MILLNHLVQLPQMTIRELTFRMLNSSFSFHVKSFNLSTLTRKT